MPIVGRNNYVVYRPTSLFKHFYRLAMLMNWIHLLLSCGTAAMILYNMVSNDKQRNNYDTSVHIIILY